MEKEITRIIEMERLYDKVLKALCTFGKAAEDCKQIQDDVKKLEAYYTSGFWKKDFEMDERGEIPPGVKRGVLSEDGIYDMLERNKKIMDILGDKK